MIYIGLDDTDNLETPGTGRLARDLAATLPTDSGIVGVTRHQLLQDARIPFTAKNSTNVVILDGSDENLEELLDRVVAFVLPRCAPGSDPAVCVVRENQVAGLTHGQRCQTEVVTVKAARETADARGILLRSLAGSPCGIIGALAGVCLSATGNDGRFIQLGQVRDLTGCVPVARILESGVARVQTEDGVEVPMGMIDTKDKLRPAFREGKAVLYVSPAGPDAWEALKK